MTKGMNTCAVLLTSLRKESVKLIAAMPGAIAAGFTTSHLLNHTHTHTKSSARIATLEVGLGDPGGLFQPIWFSDLVAIINALFWQHFYLFFDYTGVSSPFSFTASITIYTQTTFRQTSKRLFNNLLSLMPACYMPIWSFLVSNSFLKHKTWRGTRNSSTGPSSKAWFPIMAWENQIMGARLRFLHKNRRSNGIQLPYRHSPEERLTSETI